MRSRDIWKRFSKYIFIATLIGICIWGYFCWGTFVMKKALIIGLMVFLCFLWIIEYYQKLKYKSPQFVANNMSGSISERPQIWGVYAIFRLGGIHYSMGAIQLSKGNEATVIVRKESVYAFGNNFASTSQMEMIPEVKVPSELMDYLEEHKYPLNVIWFGEYSEIQRLQHPRIQEFFDSKKEKRARENELKYLLKDRQEFIEKSVAHSGRVRRKLEDKKSFALKRPKLEEEEEF